MPLRTLLEHAEVQPGQGVLIGGYFGTWLSPEVARSVTLSRGGLAAAGPSLGCGAIVALPADVCPLMELARVTRWLAGESAGQCGPCAFGLPAIAGAIEDLAAGGRPRESLAALGRWLPMVDKRGGCKLPDGVVRFVSSGLQVFADHVAEHQRHACPHAGAAAVLPVPVRPGTVAMTFRLVLDPIACDGHGICAELFPEGIRLDDWGYPILAAGDVPPAWRAHARRAADRVPEAGAHDRPWRRAVARVRRVTCVLAPRRSEPRGRRRRGPPPPATTRRSPARSSEPDCAEVPVGPARRAPRARSRQPAQAVVRALRRWNTPRITRAVITPAATKATVAAMPAMRPIVDQAKVESSRPRSVSPLNRVLRWLVMASALACSSATAAVL